MRTSPASREGLRLHKDPPFTKITKIPEDPALRFKHRNAELWNLTLSEPIRVNTGKRVCLLGSHNPLDTPLKVVALQGRMTLLDEGFPAPTSDAPLVTHTHIT